MSPAPAAAAAAAQPDGAAGRTGGLLKQAQNGVHNRVLALLVGAGLAAAWGGAVVTVAPNRLVTGRPVALGDVLAQHPQMRSLLAPVFKALDGTTLQTLNAKIALEGQDAKQVAAAWLKAKGFVK